MKRKGRLKIHNKNKKEYNQKLIIKKDYLCLALLEYFCLKVSTTKATILYKLDDTYHLFVWVIEEYEEEKDYRNYQQIFENITKLFANTKIEMRVGKTVPYDIPEHAMISTPEILDN